MIMWAAVPFFSTLILLGAFFGFLAWERKRGVRLFDVYRSALDEKVLRSYHRLVVGEIPASWRRIAFDFLHKTAHKAVVVSVEVLRAVERPLSKLSHRMRTRPPSVEGKEVSAFLKNIAPEKKNGATPPAVD